MTAMAIESVSGVVPSQRTRLRQIGLTIVTTAVICSFYDLLLLSDPPPLRDLLTLHLATTVIITVAAVVATTVLSHWDPVTLSLLAGATAGVTAGFGLSLAEGIGTGEELNGLVFRLAGAAIVGLLTATVAWAVVRRSNR